MWSFLSEKKYFAWIVYSCSGLSFFYESIQQNMYNSLSPYLMQDYSLNALQIGELSAYFLGAQLLITPIAGLLMDYYSVRKLTIYTMLMAVIGIFLFVHSATFAMLKIACVLQGIGTAFCFLNSMKLMAHWLPIRYATLATALLVFMFFLGGILVQTPFTYVIMKYNWHIAVMGLGYLGVFLTMVICLFVYDYPIAYRGKFSEKELCINLKEIKHNILLSLQNYQTLICGAYACLMNLPLIIFGGIFENIYLQQARGLTKIQAANISCMLFIGTTVGTLLLGFLAYRQNNNKLIMKLSAMISFLLALILSFVMHLDIVLLYIIFFTLGFITSAQNLVYPIILRQNHPNIIATAMGVTSVIILAGGVLLNPLFGWLVTLKWGGGVVANLPVYTGSNYQYAMFIFPCAFLICIFLVFLIKDNYCIAEQPELSII